MANKILFLSTLNLACNPRLVKEIRLAIENGFEVEVICFEFNNWSRELNEQLKNELSSKIILVSIPAGRNPLLQWIKSVSLEKFWRAIGKIAALRSAWLSQALSRRSLLLIAALKKVSPPDLVVGHNPGALYATLYAAQQFECKAGFDVEDYHPGEGNDLYIQLLTRRLMQLVLPKMNYVSFASPLIREEVSKDIGGGNGNWITILNCFSASEFTEPNPTAGPLKLVWFSQNISEGRGLEYLVSIMDEISARAELHLFGNQQKNKLTSDLEKLPNVFIHEPLAQKKLHEQLCSFDIGLALEPAKDRNNELAISNKLLAYLQAGLYIIATDTPGQKEMMKNFADHGILCEQSSEDVLVKMQLILQNHIPIQVQKEKRFKDAQELDWSKGSAPLLKAWIKCMSP